MGRILALDFGLKRVGAAISDRDVTLASPLEVYERRTESLDAKHYRELVAEESVDRIVIGLPVFASGAESQISTKARAWGQWLSRACGKPVVFFDERYSTQEAEERLRDAGLRGKALKARSDMMAAHVLLQSYIDAGCPKAPAEPKALED